MKSFCVVMALVFCVVLFAQEGENQNKESDPNRPGSAPFDAVYPAFARELVQDYGVTRGIAVDLGGSSGALAFELARITELKIYNKQRIA